MGCHFNELGVIGETQSPNVGPQRSTRSAFASRRRSQAPNDENRSNGFRPSGRRTADTGLRRRAIIRRATATSSSISDEPVCIGTKSAVPPVVCASGRWPSTLDSQESPAALKVHSAVPRPGWGEKTAQDGIDRWRKIEPGRGEGEVAPQRDMMLRDADRAQQVERPLIAHNGDIGQVEDPAGEVAPLICEQRPHTHPKQGARLAPHRAR
jgi:hypothetical protein